jgi:hypothetical protein
LGVEYPSYHCRQKVQILLFKSKWDTLSVLNIENENHFVFKNRGATSLNKKWIRGNVGIRDTSQQINLIRLLKQEKRCVDGFG